MLRAIFKQGEAYKTCHAWNAVRVQGHWALLDPCWGAGNVGNGIFNRDFSPQWFLTPPAFFGLRHFPEPGKERWQLLAKPYSFDQYMGIVAPTGHAIALGLKPLSHPKACVTADADGRLTMTFACDSKVELTTSLKRSERCICDRDAQGNHRILVAAQRGETELHIYGKPAAASGPLHSCFTYQVRSPITCSWIESYKLQAIVGYGGFKITRRCDKKGAAAATNTPMADEVAAGSAVNAARQLKKSVSSPCISTIAEAEGGTPSKAKSIARKRPKRTSGGRANSTIRRAPQRLLGGGQSTCGIEEVFMAMNARCD